MGGLSKHVGVGVLQAIVLIVLVALVVLIVLIALVLAVVVVVVLGRVYWYSYEYQCEQEYE